MALKEVFGSAGAEHESDHPTPAARPVPIVEEDRAFGRLLFPMLRVRDDAFAGTGVAEAIPSLIEKEQGAGSSHWRPHVQDPDH